MHTHTRTRIYVVLTHTPTLKIAYDKKTITDDDLNTAIRRLFTYR